MHRFGFVIMGLLGCGAHDGSWWDTGPATSDGGSDAEAAAPTQQQDAAMLNESGPQPTTSTDSGGPPPPPPPTGPTWTQIFNSYLAGGTEGTCSSCHSQSSSAKSAYTWLQGRGYISGTSSMLVSTSASCLSWFGGNMPPSGPNDATAVSDMNAWAAAGALDN